MKTFKQFIEEMPNQGPSTPIKYYGPNMGFDTDRGATRIGKVRFKKGGFINLSPFGNKVL